MAQAALKESKKYDSAPYEEASATLLAAQPADPKSEATEETKKWAELRGHLENRLSALRTWRYSWWNNNWNDLAEFILPRRSLWLTQNMGGTPTPNNMSRGKPINSAIVDPTATLAARVCSAGLMSGLASPSRPWFKVIPGIKNVDIDGPARNWLDEVEDRIYTVLSGSNFYNSFAQECEDLVVFGTGPCLIYEDEKDLIRLYNPAVGEYYLSSSASLRVDGFYRQFVMTIAQIVDFFGVDNCPADIQQMWKEKGNALEEERIIAHSVEPNFGIGSDNAGKLPGSFTWREVYWVWGAGSAKPLSMRGFMDQPFTAARWATQSNDAYGRSPGMDVLPDVMQLQVMTRRMAEAIEKQVRPPLVADMSMKNQPSSSLPGHVTYTQGLGPGTGMRPIYEVMPDVNAMSANILAIEKRIQVGFFNDLFLMLQENPTNKMTAYEVAAKLNEKLQVIGPIIESLLSESLKPKLKRVYNILLRKGMIAPKPDSIKNIPLDLEFVSMLALAQKAAATGGIERLFAFVGGLETFFPQAKDNVDPDEAIREMNELLGNPSKIVRGPQDLAALREAQAKQQEQQQEMAGISQMAEAAGKMAPAAQVLSNISPPGATTGAGGAAP